MTVIDGDWDIGRMILERQKDAGWGAKVIDRLAADLREAFPDLKGFSPRNLKYMRAFAAAWPEREIVQEPLARIPWYQHIALLEKLDDRAERVWYTGQALALKRPIGVAEWETKLVERLPKALKGSLPTVEEIEAELSGPARRPPRVRRGDA